MQLKNADQSKKNSQKCELGFSICGKIIFKNTIIYYQGIGYSKTNLNGN